MWTWTSFATPARGRGPVQGTTVGGARSIKKALQTRWMDAERKIIESGDVGVAWDANARRGRAQLPEESVGTDVPIL